MVDIKIQVHELATSVYQIRGHIKGKTLLPFPQGAKHIDEEERKAKASSGKECNIQLKNAIEGIIIKWAYQVDEVLSKDSAEEIADGKTPGPMTEINFWEAKCINLESLFEQVHYLNIKCPCVYMDLLLDALQYCNQDGQHPLPH